jgi:hypothetical protein
MEQTKICNVCKTEKSLDFFYLAKNGTFGRRGDCKECKRAKKRAHNTLPSAQAKAKAYREANKDREREQARKRDATPEAKQHRSERRMIKSSGLTIEKYNLLFEKQKGICLVCEKSPAPGNKLVPDHNHETGEIRGLLHIKCNLGIGNLQDDPILCRKAATYLETAKTGLFVPSY